MHEWMSTSQSHSLSPTIEQSFRTYAIFTKITWILQPQIRIALQRAGIFQSCRKFGKICPFGSGPALIWNGCPQTEILALLKRSGLNKNLLFIQEEEVKVSRIYLSSFLSPLQACTGVKQRVKLWKSKKAKEQTCEVSEKVKVKMLFLLALLSPVAEACTGPGLACQPLPGLQTLDIADPDYLVQTPEGQVNNCCKTWSLKSSCPVLLNRSKAKAWFLQLARLLGLGRGFHMLNNPGDGAHRNPSKTSPFDSRGKIGSFMDWKKTVFELWPGRSGMGSWTAPNWARSVCSTNLTQTWPWPLSARWLVNENYV